MPGRPTPFAASLFMVALVAVSCSVGGDGSSSSVSPPATTAPVAALPEPVDDEQAEDGPNEVADTIAAAPVTTVPRPPVELATLDEETGEIVIEEVDTGRPLTFEAVVARGVDQGLWSEAEGLIRLLRAFLGETSTDQVPGFDGVLSRSLSGLIASIDTVEDATAGEIEELARLRRIVVPPIEAVEALTIEATPGGPGDAVRVPSAASPADCATIQADAFSSSTTIGAGCYLMIESSAGGARLRVFFPAWYPDTSLADFPQAALEALVTSVEVYAGLGTVGDMDLIFSLADDAEGNLAIAVDAAAVDWGTATFAGTCPITMFPAAGSSFGSFQQTVAHEAWHCVQHYSSDMSDYDSTAWFMEGGAEYFSNVVYPTVDAEHVWLASFDQNSLTSSLLALDYQTWIFWQYLANVSSPRAVADLHVAMSRAGDGGRSIMQGYGAQLQDFAIAYVAGRIADASGAPLPRARYAVIQAPITEDDEGETVTLSASPFVIRRFLLTYRQEYRFLQSDVTETDGREAMVEWDKVTEIDEWKGIFPEIRSECERDARYAVAATTVDGQHEVKLQIDTVERAECDPCLLGTWELRLDTFRELLARRLAAENLPADAEFELLGGYFTAFEDDAVFKDLRDGFTIRATVQGFSVEFVIDAFGQGSYTADGERLTLSDVVDLAVGVTSSVGPGFEQSSGLAGEAGNASGTYECDDDVLVVTLEGETPLTFDRVDRILEPPARD